MQASAAERALSDQHRAMIQARLIGLGFLVGEPDGAFGMASRRAIRSYQESVGARPTGVLTRTQISALLGASTGPIPLSSDGAKLRGLERPTAPSARIEGELSYPSDYLPDDLTVCAVDLATSHETCTSKRVRLKRKLRPAGYRLELAPGRYHVYSRTKDAPGRTAYFTEFVRCGADVSCPSHERIVVTLEPGTVVTDVDPGDWYDVAGQETAKAVTAAEAPSPGPPPAGPRSLALVGRADQRCEDARPVVEGLRRRLTFAVEGDRARRVGDLVKVNWSVAGPRPRAPTYLMISTASPSRFVGKGFYVLAPGAAAPFELGPSFDQIRVVLPLHVSTTAMAGSLDIRFVEAGEARLTAALIGYARCGALEDPTPKRVDLEIEAGSPEIVIADRFAVQAPDQVILSPKGTRRIDVAGSRWRLIDHATGSQLADLVGAEPRFSPTGRFVVSKVEEFFHVYDAIDGKEVHTLSGSEIAFDAKDSFILSGLSGVGGILVDGALVEPAPGGNDNVVRGGTIAFHSGSCRICSGVETSAIRIDLENNLVLAKTTQGFDSYTDAYAYSLTSREYFRDIRNKPANGSVETAPDGSAVEYHRSIAEFVARSQSVAFSIPHRWELIDGLTFTHINASYQATPGASDAVGHALRRFVLKPRLTDARAVAQAGAKTDPLAMASRGITRVSGQDDPSAEAVVARLVDFGLEINEGLRLGPVRQNLVRPAIDGKGKLLLVSDPRIAIASDFLEVPCGEAARQAKDGTAIYAFEPTAQVLKGPGFDLTVLGGLCDGGSAGFLTPMKFAHDSRRPGTVFDLIEKTQADPNVAGTTCPSRLGACGVEGQLFFDRYFVMWSKESFAVAVYDLDERKLLASLIRLPSAEVVTSYSLSRDLRTLTKIDRDGGFQVLDLADSQRSPKAPVLLSGRVIDGEVVVWNAVGQFELNDRRRQLRIIALPRPAGESTLDQYRTVLHVPDLIQRSLKGESIAPPAFTASPPAIKVTPRLHSSRLKAQVELGREPVAELRVYQDARLTDTIAVAAGSKAIDLDVPRLASARWVAVLAKGRSGLYSQPFLFDAGPDPVGQRRLHLLSVGIDRYLDPRIGQLGFAASDAKRFHEAVQAKAGHGVEIASQNLLTDERADRSTVLERLKSAIEAAEPHDTVVLFIAGHGIQSRGQYYLATSTTKIDDLEETALRWSDLSNVLARSKSRIAVFLDACHSGSAGTSIFASNNASAEALIDRVPSGIVIFSAAKGRELSAEAPSSKGGVFTNAVVSALADPATDRDANGAVEASELYANVKSKVVTTTSGRQTPWFARNDMVGDFVPF